MAVSLHATLLCSSRPRNSGQGGCAPSRGFLSVSYPPHVPAAKMSNLSAATAHSPAFCFTSRYQYPWLNSVCTCASQSDVWWASVTLFQYSCLQPHQFYLSHLTRTIYNIHQRIPIGHILHHGKADFQIPRAHEPRSSSRRRESRSHSRTGSETTHQSYASRRNLCSNCNSSSSSKHARC